MNRDANSSTRGRRRRNAEPRVSGIVNLYKPVGESSAQYVYRLRKVFDEWKVGHAGTLDPFADGVLVACIGRGTKLVERIMHLPKIYLTTLHLGVTNATFDTEHPFEPVPGASRVERAAIDSALEKFRGEIDQAPPVYSAVKVGGRPSYELARQGAAEERPTRRVRIHKLTVASYDWPRLTLQIQCSRGTYIRAIARDLGAALGVGACCETLRREAVGPFDITNALRLNDTPPDEQPAALISVESALELIVAAETTL